MVEACIVSCLFDAKPIGLVDSSAGGCSGPRERRHNLQPPTLRTRNGTDLVRHLHQILVLAVDHGHVEFATSSQTHYVQAQPQVYSLLLANFAFNSVAVRKADRLRSISNRAGIDGYPSTTHRQQAALPIAVPHRASLCRRGTRVEANATAHPAERSANCFAELEGVIVGMVMAERVFGMPIEVLSVNERHSPLNPRFAWHNACSCTRPKNNPAGALRQVRRGGIAAILALEDVPVKHASMPTRTANQPPCFAFS